MKTIIYLAACLLVCGGCKGGNTTKEQTTTANATDTARVFTLPQIPPMYTSPEQRGDFLVKHYWDNFNFTDTAYIHLPDVTEQAFVDFLDVTNHVPLQTARDGMARLMTGAEKDKKVFDYFVSLADKYLYDPNSPFRNEELYIVVLEKTLESSHLDEVEKTRPRYRLQLAQKNRLGTKALNFTYTTSSGKQGTLYGISAPYTLVYINNPGCHACEEITQGMKQSQIIQRLLDEKKLTILCIYPDEDLEEWKNHLGDFPRQWINGYDKGTAMRDKDLYDLRAIPSLYLLNHGKVVLLKDATLPQVEQFLYSKNQ